MNVQVKAVEKILDYLKPACLNVAADVYGKELEHIAPLWKSFAVRVLASPPDSTGKSLKAWIIVRWGSYLAVSLAAAVRE